MNGEGLDFVTRSEAVEISTYVSATQVVAVLVVIGLVWAIKTLVMAALGFVLRSIAEYRKRRGLPPIMVPVPSGWADDDPDRPWRPPS